MQSENAGKDTKTNVISTVYADFISRLEQDKSLPNSVVTHFKDLLKVQDFSLGTIRAALFSEDDL